MTPGSSRPNAGKKVREEILAVLSVCDECGMMEERAAPRLVETHSDFVEETGFLPERHVIELHGMCASCGSDTYSKTGEQSLISTGCDSRSNRYLRQTQRFLRNCFWPPRPMEPTDGFHPRVKTAIRETSVQRTKCRSNALKMPIGRAGRLIYD